MPLDPFTAHKRSKIFSKRKFAEEITRRQDQHLIDARKIILGIPKVLAQIERNKVLPTKEKAFRKARFISDQAANLVDARIDAELKTASKRGIDIFEALPPLEKKAIWDERYEDTMRGLSGHPIIASDPLIMEQLKFIQSFFTMPNKIREKRAKHVSIIRKVIEHSLSGNRNPSEGLLKEVDRLLARIRQNESMKVKAMDVCVAVSIYADVMERRGESWPTAYRDGMKLAYLKIKKNQALLDAIASI